MASRFLFSATLWNELSARVPKAKKVRAAVAYFGTGGATLLPLKKGDSLVVDMSLGRVRAGATDPREIKKLLLRGVNVFTRASLHAKFFVLDRMVLAGSSNISSHSKNTLEEAAILTDDAAAVQRATTTFDQLCTEPVRKDYLAKCLEEYRPPAFAGGGKRGKRGKRQQVQAKLWFIGGLVYRSIPASEEDVVEKVVKEAERKLMDFERSEVEYTHYPDKQKFMTRLREGDWLIPCIRKGERYEVWPPSRFLGIERYPRGAGKFRYLVLYEQPTDAESIAWSTVRKRAAAVALSSKPRTVPIASETDADTILRMWDHRGRFRKRPT